MASPMMRARQPGTSGDSVKPTFNRRRAALRLLAAERAEEIFPVLLEEIIALGFARAIMAEVDFETGELRPVASLNCPRSFQDKFRLSLWADNPVVRVLHSMEPAVIPYGKNPDKKLYCHPLVYSNKQPCWEAEREHRPDCLAVLNNARARRLHLNEQVCGVCDMRAFTALALVEVPARGMEREQTELAALIEMGNRYLSRLFKVEHYYNRMRDMETTIAQMNTVMQSMPDPVILTDAQHRVIMQNRAAARFFKLPDEISEGLVHAVELNNLLFSAALSSMAVSDAESSRDLTLVDAIEGEEVLFEAVCAPTLSRDGVRLGMVTVMRDVTDLRRADEELRANYERLRAAEEVVRQDRDRLNLIVENVGDPIGVCDSNAKFVLVDPLANELFGSDDPGARDANQMKNLAKFDAYITAFTFAFSHKESAPLRLYNPTSQTEIEYDARSGKIYDERGQVSYTVTVLRDFTALRKLEQLRMERRMLEMEKFAATGRLAGTIAHEINNPMEAIKNAIFLLETSVKPEAGPIYDILKKETERVARIVRQMLGLYRHSEQVGTVDINGLVDETLQLFSRQLERSSVKVNAELSELPPIVGSSDQLRQVVSNLVVNARDSMPETGGRLYVRTRHIPAPDGVHGKIHLIVADTGYGIPEQSLATIFEPFFSTKGEKGTGLGLWIVKGILENHSGKIRVRSRVGKGTVFKIELPVVR
jgi:signal transduction histidine kinase